MRVSLTLQCLDRSMDMTRPFMIQDREPSNMAEADRTLEELQAALMQASRISAVEAMAVTLAHELNQPLTAIANYIETVRDLLGTPDHDPAELREALGDAALQSLRAGQIVRRLRGFVAKSETDKAVCSLGTIVDEARALALMGVDTQAIDIRTLIDPAADLVIVNRGPVQQVLFNLIRNAIEAEEYVFGKRIEITARPISNMHVKVVVADNGAGLSSDVQAALFEPFRSSKPNGLGLGLSICRTIIEGQGGRIWHEASPLGGSAFHFTLARAHGVLSVV